MLYWIQRKKGDYTMRRRNLVCTIACLGTLGFIGYRMPNRGVFAFVIVMCLLYGAASIVSEWGIRSFKKIKDAVNHGGRLTDQEKKKLFGYSLAILSPMHCCILIASAIPIFSYGAWFVTLFPILIITAMPFITVLDAYTAFAAKKRPFILVNLAISLLCTAVIQGIVHTAF